jgi:hypothetical protein
MRDGIPKTIPVPRKWQRVVECADRTADRGTSRVVDRLLEAIKETTSKAFPADDRKILVQACDDVQLSLPGIDLPRLSNLKEVGRHKQNVEAVLRNADKAVKIGHKTSEAICDALAAKMQSDAAAHLRQIREDLAGKCKPNELQRVCAELDRVAGLVNWRDEASRMLKGSSVGDAHSKQRLDPDEDLR